MDVPSPPLSNPNSNFTACPTDTLSDNSFIPPLTLPAAAIPCAIPPPGIRANTTIHAKEVNSAKRRKVALAPKGVTASATTTTTTTGHKQKAAFEPIILHTDKSMNSLQPEREVSEVPEALEDLGADNLPPTPPRSTTMVGKSPATKRRESRSGHTEEERELKRKARKTAHSDIERRRRIKINEQFDALKSLVPACNQFTAASGGDVGLHKLVILQETVQFIKYLKSCIETVEQSGFVLKSPTSFASGLPPHIQSPFINSNLTSNGFHRADGRSASISSLPSISSSPSLSAGLNSSSSSKIPPLASTLTLPPPALPAPTSVTIDSKYSPPLDSIVLQSIDTPHSGATTASASSSPGSSPAGDSSRLKISNLLC